MEQFSPGTVLKSTLGLPIVIESYIGGGGQGDVYKVLYDGSPKALKWYNRSSIKDFKAFHDNLERNIEKGKPDQAFIWPEALTEIKDGTFGYVMDLIPDGYKEFTKFLVNNGGGGFTTFKAVIQVGLKLVSAFRVLHNNGYCYQDLSAGNFFIHPQKGDVLICDNDNVAPVGTYSGIMGTPPYIAPEIIRGETKPSSHTDEYSLAVVLFMLFFTSHPLEGERWTAPCLSNDVEKMLYGTAPVFIMDKDNDKNRPVKGIHNNVLKRWDFLPNYLKDTFQRAFSQESLLGQDINGNKVYPRVKEFEWIKVLVRFQSDIVRCPYCGNEVFITDVSDTLCDRCDNVYKVKNKLRLYEYSVTAAKNTIIYRCQLGICNVSDALTKIGLIVEKGDESGVLGYRNMMNSSITAVAPNGKTKPLESGKIIPLISGVTLKILDGKIEIK